MQLSIPLRKYIADVLGHGSVGVIFGVRIHIHTAQVTSCSCLISSISSKSRSILSDLYMAIRNIHFIFIVAYFSTIRGPFHFFGRGSRFDHICQMHCFDIIIADIHRWAAILKSRTFFRCYVMVCRVCLYYMFLCNSIAVGYLVWILL